MNKPTDEQLAALDVRIGELVGERPHLSYEVTPPGGGNTCFSADSCKQAQDWLDELLKRYPESWVKGRVVTEWKHYKCYTKSLDAMHEAEKALIGVEKYWQFGSNVRDVISTGSTGDGTIRCGWPTALHAEAWQRAIALDRTLSEMPLL